MNRLTAAAFASFGKAAHKRGACCVLTFSASSALAPGLAHRHPRDLLVAYLGGDAADRVSAGQVQRGAVSRIAAAIFFADVRGFTNFAEETAPEEVARHDRG